MDGIVVDEDEHHVDCCSTSHVIVEEDGDGGTYVRIVGVFDVSNN